MGNAWFAVGFGSHREMFVEEGLSRDVLGPFPCFCSSYIMRTRGQISWPRDQLSARVLPAARAPPAFSLPTTHLFPVFQRVHEASVSVTLYKGKILFQMCVELRLWLFALFPVMDS